jgi:thioredoxin-related protein
LLLSVFGMFSANALAQEKNETKGKEEAVKDTLLPYQKYPTLPAFNIRLLDSSVFNTYNIPKGKPIILMLFMPECKHCIKTTEALEKGMDSLKHIQFYLMTPLHDFAAIRKFYHELHLDQYKNIKVVGRDYEFFFHDFYGIKSIPSMALYDGNKRLIHLFEGETTVAEIYKYAR